MHKPAVVWLDGRESKRKARWYASAQALASGVRGAGPLSSPCLLYSTRCINHTVSRADSTQCTLSIEYAGQDSCIAPPALGQQTINNNNTLSCPALPCVHIRVSSGRAGAGSMADVSDVQRQAVLCTRDMRITTRANIGTPDFDGGWQLALWQIGDLMMESLPLTGVRVTLPFT